MHATTTSMLSPCAATRPSVVTASLLLMLTVAACGGDDRAPEGTAVAIDVAMTEYAFATPETVLTAGVPHRFTLRNDGREAHEWAVVPHGDRSEARLLTEVEEAELPPGATVVHEFTFPRVGRYDFACFLPGHYEAGMVMPIVVQ